MAPQIAARPATIRLLLVEDDDERRGIEAVGAGAQDYLVKGKVDGHGLARAVRYAIERRRADEARRQLELARVQAEENARLERGVLPAPLVSDPGLALSAHYRPGRRRALLGGDFYDAVQTPDGAVHVVIGDVSGHGPDAAALGVLDGVRWRAREHPLPERWALLLYTDGLIEGRVGAGPRRLGVQGLAGMVRGELTRGEDGLLAALVERAEELNGGPLLDDVAALLVRWRPE